MSIKKDIDKLLAANIIDQSTGERIRTFYLGDQSQSSSRLLLIFGVLGSILVGLGVILILAHNWDMIPKLGKVIISFLPLVFSQILCGVVLFKPIDKDVWKESASTLLFFGIGASIALISQVYHLPSDMSGYLLIWMILVLPIIYAMKSKAVSALFIIGITAFAIIAGNEYLSNISPIYYWPLLVSIIPFYLTLVNDFVDANSTSIHHWLIAISVGIGFNSLINWYSENQILALVTNVSLLGIYYAIGHRPYFESKNLRSNPFKVIGSLGTIMILLVVSFDYYWEDLLKKGFEKISEIGAFEIGALVVTTCMSLALVIFNFVTREKRSIKPIEFVFLIFLALFFVGLFNSIPFVFVNILLFVIALLTILEGANENHLGILNYGLLIITALITCRFFDVNITFVVKGLLFVLVGVSFFVANYWFLSKRKNNG